jgi:hypothetical protein
MAELAFRYFTYECSNPRHVQQQLVGFEHQLDQQQETHLWEYCNTAAIIA